MAFTLRPYRRLPVQGPVTYHAGPFRMLPPVSRWGLGQRKRRII